MARPRIALPLETVREAFREHGTVRGAAQALGVSRYVVRTRLHEAGLSTDTYEPSSRRVLLDTATRTEERVEAWGDSTEVVYAREVPYDPCAWPGCSEERSDGALCAVHAVAAQEGDGWRCAWPRCPQETSGGLCYAHSKISRGLTT